jgi:hypothetical protein
MFTDLLDRYVLTDIGRASSDQVIVRRKLGEFVFIARDSEDRNSTLDKLVHHCTSHCPGSADHDCKARFFSVH